MRRDMDDERKVMLTWIWIAVSCTVATVVGYALADVASDELQAGLNGLAAGALLVMLVDSMIPEATEQAGRTTGLMTALGFAVAAGLSLA
jgi:ZIP family zinc transporter